MPGRISWYLNGEQLTVFLVFACGSCFINWQLVALSYQMEITLDEQPCGVRMEYRVIASNPAGNSLPGNVVAVVL